MQLLFFFKKNSVNVISFLKVTHRVSLLLYNATYSIVVLRSSHRDKEVFATQVKEEDAARKGRSKGRREGSNEGVEGNGVLRAHYHRAVSKNS